MLKLKGFKKYFFWGASTHSEWVCDGYSGLCGVREGYFGGFRQKNEKNMTVTGGVQSVLGMSWGRLGHFFDLKTPKKTLPKVSNMSKTGWNGLTGHFWGIFVPKEAL